MYVFQARKKGVLQKSYALIGNPEKTKMMDYFNLDVLTPDGGLEKNFDKVNVGASFFEHMTLFQSERGKKEVGKAIQIWGYFVHVPPYERLNKSIAELITMDLPGSLPTDLLYRKKEPVQHMFVNFNDKLQ